MQKLPVPNITLNTQDQGAVFQGKMNSLADACKTAVQAYNNQIDAAQTAQQFSEAAQQAVVDADVAPILQRLDMTLNIAPVIDLDFRRGEYTVYQSPELPFQKKQLAEVITTNRNSAASLNTPYGEKTVGANLPRIEFDPTTGECLGLLTQDLRTNLIRGSNSFDDVAYWNPTQLTVTQISNYFLLAPTTVSATHQIQLPTSNRPTVIAGQPYVFQLKVRGAGINSCWLRLDNNASSSTWSGTTPRAIFNLIDGSFSSVSGEATAKSKRLHDNWWLLTISGTPSETAPTSCYILVGESSQPYAGNNVDGIEVQRAQLEAGTTETSYINTTTSQVARDGDDLTRANEHFGAMTVYVEFFDPTDSNDNSSVMQPISLGNTGATAQRGFTLVSNISGNGAKNWRVRLSDGIIEAADSSPITTGLVDNGWNKAAIVLDPYNKTFRMAINGVVGSPVVYSGIFDASFLSTIYFNRSTAGAGASSRHRRRNLHRQFKFFSRALSASQLIKLTRLT